VSLAPHHQAPASIPHHRRPGRAILIPAAVELTFPINRGIHLFFLIITFFNAFLFFFPLPVARRVTVSCYSVSGFHPPARERLVLVLSQGLGPNRPFHPPHQVFQVCSRLALHPDPGCMLPLRERPPPPPSPRDPPQWGDGDVVAYHTARGDHSAAIAFAERLLRTPSVSAALRAEMQGSLPTGPSRDRGGG